jgi:uncharacterized membrane protein YqiK
MEGVKEAVETVKEMVVPWQRKNSQRKANLENVLRQAEIQKLNAETLIAQAKADRERAGAQMDQTQAELALAQVKKTEAEANLILAQTEKAKAEAEKEWATLRQSQIELALQIVERYAPGLHETQKMDYVIKLLQILNRLLSSRLELR